MRVPRLFAAVFFAALPFAASAQQLTVSAAASLTEAFREIGGKFEASRPGSTVRFNFAASGTLFQQIRQGAPVDVFASADQETMDRAATERLINTASRTNFVSNSLVMITPGADQTRLASLQDLTAASVQRIAVGKTATVPVGRYTRQTLENAGLWQPLEAKFVQADSVRQVLDYVSRGEAQAGFVYRTDAAIMGDKVRVVLTPGGHSPITYPIAIVADSKQAALAREFLQYLGSEPARAVLTRYGFGQP